MSGGGELDGQQCIDLMVEQAAAGEAPHRALIRMGIVRLNGGRDRGLKLALTGGAGRP
jgi:hypothetical protein